MKFSIMYYILIAVTCFSCASARNCKDLNVEDTKKCEEYNKSVTRGLYLGGNSNDFGNGSHDNLNHMMHHSVPVTTPPQF